MALVLNQKDKKVKLIFRTVDEGLSLNLADETDQVIYQVSSEHEKAILDYLLERAGLVAITLEENKDRIVMRNNHEGFVEEIETLKAQLRISPGAAAATTEKPVGVEKYPYHWYDLEFFKGYGKSQLKQFILDQQDQMKMMHDQMARTIAKKDVKLNELMFPPEKVKSRVVEINWGEEEGEDSAVQNPVRNEREIRMEILKLTLELLSVTSGMSKEEIIDHCLERTKKDEQIRQMDDSERRVSIRANIGKMLIEKGYVSINPGHVVSKFALKNNLTSTPDETTDQIGKSWQAFREWFDETFPKV